MKESNCLSEGLCIKIYLSESDEIDGHPALTAIIELCQQAGLRGVSVVRGIEGLGSHGLHSGSFLALSHHLPLLVEAVDNRENIENALKFMTPHLQGFLVAIWPVQLLQTNEDQ